MVLTISGSAATGNWITQNETLYMSCYMLLAVTGQTMNTNQRNNLFDQRLLLVGLDEKDNSNNKGTTGYNICTL